MTNNQLPTQVEVLARFQERKANDILGFEVGEYINVLDFETARSIDALKEDVTAEQWAKVRTELSREALLKAMLDYMPFAWEKANGCRGISANRSVAHYIAWTWLAGDRGLSTDLEGDYEFYGKPQLIKVCEHYGWDWKQWDNGIRTNTDS